MKGLLIKDFRLMWNQGKIFLLTVVVLSIIMGATGAVDPSFTAAYITVIFSLFTVSTISYDEYDNCYLFLLALPVTRKTYVCEKYLYGLLVTIFSWCFGMLAGAGLMICGNQKVNLTEWTGSSILYVLVAWILLSIMIPVRLRFDIEKTRYANMIIVIGIFFLIYIGRKFFNHITADNLREIESYCEKLGSNIILLISGAVVLCAVVVSYFCSSRIMKQKEF